MLGQSLERTGHKPVLGLDVIIFFALYIVLPDYFAIEFSQNFPLITASRFLLAIVGICLLFRKREKLFSSDQGISAWNFGLTNDLTLRYGLFFYFTIITICNAALLPADAGEAVKATLIILIENYFLIWMLTLILDEREKLILALKIVVISSGIIGIISAIGCVLGINPFHYLNTVQRYCLMTQEIRLGMLRAAAGFGHPVYYGAFCVVVLPLVMYFLEHSEKRAEKYMYSLCFSMNVVGMVLSNARGAMVAFAFLLLVCVTTSILKKTFKKFFKTYAPVALQAILILAFVSALSPVGLNFLIEYLVSIVKIVFPGSSLQATVEYGNNPNGTLSRVKQLSGILYTLRNKPLFGFGSNAHTKGLLVYEFQPGKWYPSFTVDVGIVAVIGQYGIVGLIGYLGKWGSLFKTTLVKKKSSNPLMNCFGLSLLTYLVCLLSISSLEKMQWILIAFIVCLRNLDLQEHVGSILWQGV